MRKLLTLAAVLLTCSAYGQGIWSKSTTNTILNRGKDDSVRIIPRDTLPTNNALYNGAPVGDYGRIAAKHGFFYFHDSIRNRRVAFVDDVPSGVWGLSGNSLTSGQFLGSTNNQPVVIKTNSDTAAIFWNNGQLAVVPKINDGSALMYLQNLATTGTTNSNLNIYKPTLGGPTNLHKSGVQFFPSNNWTNISQGPVWWLGYWDAYPTNTFSFAGRDQGAGVFPVWHVNSNYMLGIGRTSVSNPVDATAMLQIAPGVDSVASMKLTEGVLLNTAEKGAYEFANNKLFYTRNTTRNEFLFKGYADTIVVAATGGDYTTISSLFSTEAEGDKLILLPDSLYEELNPQYVIKEGWHIKGQGMGKTIVRFSFDRTINGNLDGFQLKTNCTLEDVQVQSINNSGSGDFSFYAVHSDVSGEFTARVIRCHLRSVKDDPGNTDASGYNGLSVGVGTWEGQVIEFIDCLIEGQTVAMESRSVINTHNTLASSDHIKPSRLTFKNCSISGGFNAVLINDTYTGPEADQNRVQDIWEFLGCDIKGGLNFRSQGGKKNGFVFNFAGTSVDEIRSADSVVNTALSNYSAASLPMPATVQYWKNIGASNIVAGDLVAYVYANRDPYWNYSSPINAPIGIQKVTSGNYTNFAGIALTNSVIDAFAHISVGGIAYTGAAYAGMSIGENVTFNSSGVLVESNTSGIGLVARKTSTDRIGIYITPNGSKSNITLQTSTDAGAITTNNIAIGNLVSSSIPLSVSKGTSAGNSHVYFNNTDASAGTYGLVLNIANTAGSSYPLSVSSNGVDIFNVRADGRLIFMGVHYVTGSGSPEGVVTAPTGSEYTNTAGGANTTKYIKESGSGNTGWIAK